jgi:hypothetical protein
MDEDLESMNHAQLVAEVKRLRTGIRAHRDASAHELCWHHPQLWGLLPPQFLRGCIRYRQSLDRELAAAPRTTEELDPDA